MTRPLLLLLLLTGCAGAEAWWNVPTDATPGESPAGGEGDDDDDDDDDGGSGSEAFLWGEGQLDGSGAFSGEGGYVVLQWDADDDQELCSLFWTWSTSAVLDTCAACSAAFELQRGEVEAEVEDGCADNPLPATLDVATLRLGVAGEELMGDLGSGWEEVGYAEEEDGLLFFEVVTASSEGDDDEGDDR